MLGIVEQSGKVPTDGCRERAKPEQHQKGKNAAILYAG